MIVPMSKITVLALAADQAATLHALQNAGVLHLNPLQPPAGDALEQARRRVERIRRIQAVLSRIAREHPDHSSATSLSSDEGITPERLMEETDQCLQTLQDLENRRHALAEQIRVLEPLGHFDPALIRTLESHQIFVRLFRAPIRARRTIPDGVIQIPLATDGRYDHFALIASQEPSCVGATAIPLPERSLNDLRRERAEVEGALHDRQGRLVELSRLTERLAPLLAEAEERLKWEEARAGMGAKGPVVLLQGYAPRRDVPHLQRLAHRHGWGLLAEEPTAEDHPPTLIQNPPWIRPVHLVFKLIGILPGYREADVSPVFLIFFTLFVAMLIGDAVYGLLFLGLTLVLKRRRAHLPEHVIPLLSILSVATFLWGVMSGNYLGIERLPSFVERMKVPLLTDPIDLQSFCFLIGATHLSVAHAWNAIRLLPSPQAIAHLGWIGLCAAMYAVANFLVLGVALPRGFFALLILSVLYILLFTVPPQRLRAEAVSLVTLPLSLIGNFGDVVSYLRLYLVSTASVVLVKAVNGILFGAGPLGWAGMIGAGVVLFFVHALNLMLASLAVLVHGIRLNALEFSTHMGIQWLGRPYSPFRKEIPSKSPNP